VNLKEIGWNGFLVTVPEEMHLTRQGGNANQGTFTIESENALVEFSWNPIPKKPKPLLSIVESVVDRVKKRAEKKKQKFSIEEKRDTIVNNHDAIYLRLKSILDERYYIWHCKESNRLVVARFVFGTFDDKAKNFIKNFLSDVKCHAKEKYVWALMKIRFETPKSFLLNEAKIEVGRAHIVLTESKLSTFEESARTIYVNYFPMANLRFKDTYKDPEKWFEKNYLKDFRRLLRKRKIPFEKGEEKKLGDHKIIIKQATMTSGLHIRSTELCSTACWYCPETNRMYFFAVNSKTTRPIIFKRKLKKEEHNDLFNGILESFQCH